MFILFTFQPNGKTKKKSAQNSYNAIKTNLSSFGNQLKNQLTILGCFCFFSAECEQYAMG